MQVGPAFPQKVLHGGVKALRLLPVGAASPHIIDLVVGPVPALIKGHGGPHHHAVVPGPDAVQHRGDVAVVPDVVRAAAIEGDGRGGGHPAGLVRPVVHTDQHDLHTVPPGAEGGDCCVQPHVLPVPLLGVPHQAGGHRAVVLGGREAGGLLPAEAPAAEKTSPSGPASQKLRTERLLCRFSALTGSSRNVS